MNDFKKISSSSKNDTRATRNLAIIFLSPIVLVIAIVLAYWEILSWKIVAHILGTGFTIAVFIFIVLYINHLSEPSIFKIKLVGISLGTILIFIGFTGNIGIMVKDNSYDKFCISKIKYCKNSVLKNNFSGLSDKIKYIISSSINKNGSLSIFKPVYLQYNTIMDIKKYQ